MSDSWLIHVVENGVGAASKQLQKEETTRSFFTVAHKYHGKSFKSIPHNLKKYVNNYFSLVPEVLGN